MFPAAPLLVQPTCWWHSSWSTSTKQYSRLLHLSTRDQQLLSIFSKSNLFTDHHHWAQSTGRTLPSYHQQDRVHQLTFFGCFFLFFGDILQLQNVENNEISTPALTFSSIPKLTADDHPHHVHYLHTWLTSVWGWVMEDSFFFPFPLSLFVNSLCDVCCCHHHHHHHQPPSHVFWK